MIRALFGAVLPLLGLGVGAAILGPDFVASPRGEPMIVAGPDQPMLQTANFDASRCDPIVAESLVGDLAGMHILAFALRAGEGQVIIEIDDFADGSEAPRIIGLVFDQSGRLIAAGDPASLGMQGEKVGAGCVAAPESPRAPI